jgi:hypothetical protein
VELTSALLAAQSWKPEHKNLGSSLGRCTRAIIHGCVPGTESQPGSITSALGESRQTAYCFSLTRTLSICCPSGVTPAVVTIQVLPSADTSLINV